MCKQVGVGGKAGWGCGHLRNEGMVCFSSTSLGTFQGPRRDLHLREEKALDEGGNMSAVWKRIFIF